MIRQDETHGHFVTKYLRHAFGLYREIYGSPFGAGCKRYQWSES